MTMLPGTAFAGEQTKAEAAISEARGKVEAGDKVGAGEQAPQLQAQAREALVSAQDLLTNHHKAEAIVAAHHAGDLADQAIISANSRKAEMERARRDDLRGSAMDAQQSAANANVRADSAQQATAAANVRADMAQHSADTANAQADAMRNAPPPATTVAVTEHDTVRTPMVHHRHHRIVHHHARATHEHSTTTTITTSH